MENAGIPMKEIDVQNFIINLTRSIGETPTEIKAIAESGSSRKYYRVFTEKGSLIGTYSDNVEENEAFLSFTQHFLKLHFPVPHVLGVSDDKTCYLQSDFGDDNLFTHVQRALLFKGYDAPLISSYKKALWHLVRFQILGHQGLDYGKAYPSERFDRQAIIEDLNYFRYYFLKPHAEIVFNETRLLADFEAMANHLSQAPSDFFMYRDFQSRNIMIQGEEVCFIDYQGGRKGPLQYDPISLLYQVKAQMPDTIRQELLDYYKSELANFIDLNAIHFDDYYPGFVYLRLMQVLGAYGFRGLIQKKSHFLESIPYALKEMERWHQAHPLGQYSELDFVLSQLKGLQEKYDVGTANTGKLTVTINSFSFKKGYPNDFSGNGGGFVFDCRALPNPGREERFKSMTGRDWEVKEFLMEKPQVTVFLDYVKGIVAQSVDNYLERHFSNLMVSFGCTGGQHRSVFFAQTLYEWLKERYPQIHLKLNHQERKIQEEYGL